MHERPRAFSYLQVPAHFGDKSSETQSTRHSREKEETMNDDDYFELTLSDRELCEIEYERQWVEEEFREVDPAVPTDPHDGVFEEVRQPWQREEW